jgi:hypothetical protein
MELLRSNLAGKSGANAGPGARGFIGIAFRVQWRLKELETQPEKQGFVRLVPKSEAWNLIPNIERIANEANTAY